MLARCRSQNITEYYASVLQPGSTELMIIMELMAASVFDVVGSQSCSLPSNCSKTAGCPAAFLLQLL